MVRPIKRQIKEKGAVSSISEASGDIFATPDGARSDRHVGHLVGEGNDRLGNIKIVTPSVLGNDCSQSSFDAPLSAMPLSIGDVVTPV